MRLRIAGSVQSLGSTDAQIELSNALQVLSNHVELDFFNMLDACFFMLHNLFAKISDIVYFFCGYLR